MLPRWFLRLFFSFNFGLNGVIQRLFKDARVQSLYDLCSERQGALLIGVCGKNDCFRPYSGRLWSQICVFWHSRWRARHRNRQGLKSRSLMAYASLFARFLVCALSEGLNMLCVITAFLRIGLSRSRRSCRKTPKEGNNGALYLRPPVGELLPWWSTSALWYVFQVVLLPAWVLFFPFLFFISLPFASQCHEIEYR